MRLPFYSHLTYNPNAIGSYDAVDVVVSHFYTAERYTIGELGKAFWTANDGKPRIDPSGEGHIIGNGQRNSTLFSIAGGHRRKGLGEMEILAAIHEVNQERVFPKLDDDELREIARSVMRYAPGSRDGVSMRIPSLPDGALYGLAGEIVRTLEPHTEADNSALLMQLLAGFGCLIGRTAFFPVEADEHHTKLFVIIVGATSKGRKGTSWGRIRQILTSADPTFSECIQDGLSSGEGLIHHVRDEQSKKTPIKEKGRITGYQDEIVDAGALEKRALVLEPEFARVLKVMQREGNTLSSVIRQAWDTDRLRVMTKTPLVASKTHIGVIAHITANELLRNLDQTEMANGFANRFLWVLSRRSKPLPFGSSLKQSDLAPLIHRLQDTISRARNVSAISRDAEADLLWQAVYEDLSDGKVGLLGAVTSRAEAQVMRLATIYALLDCSLSIQRAHLQAALSLWGYCLDSARYTFGEQTGDRFADKIYAALEDAPEGLSRTQLRDLFSRNASSGQVSNGLRTLIELGRIYVTVQRTDGRNVEIFKVSKEWGNDQNDKRSREDSR